MKTYSFKHPEITDCFDCPMFYDRLYCKAGAYEDSGLVRSVKKEGNGYFTVSVDGMRPNWCPLREIIEVETNIAAMPDTSNYMVMAGFYPWKSRED